MQNVHGGSRNDGNPARCIEVVANMLSYRTTIYAHANNYPSADNMRERELLGTESFRVEIMSCISKYCREITRR